MLQASNLAPNFAFRRNLVADDLRRLHEPCVIFEHQSTDSDGIDAYWYTVGGILDGEVLPDGCTVAGEVALVHADSRADADAIAVLGLHDTIIALDGEAAMYIDAHAALARLQSVGAQTRIELAMKPASERSDQLMADQAAIRPLIGDDIVLTVGGVEH